MDLGSIEPSTFRVHAVTDGRPFRRRYTLPRRVLYFVTITGAVGMDVEELYQRGFDARCEGRYSEARALLQQVLAAKPDHVDAKWQIGLIEGFEGDFDGSYNTLQTLVNANPNHLNARYDLAMTMMMLGMIDEACAEFREILRQNPAHEKAKQQLVYCP